MQMRVVRKDLLPEPDRRRCPRDQVHWTTTVRATTVPEVEVLVLDISPMGFSAGCHREFGDGEWIQVELPVVGDLDAGVVWCIAGHFGASFAEPIAPEPYTQLLDVLRGNG